MIDFSQKTLYDVVSDLKYGHLSPEDTVLYDQELANRLTDFTVLGQYSYSFYHLQPQDLPVTKQKVNAIIAPMLSGGEYEWSLRHMAAWIDSATETIILSSWLDSDSNKRPSYWLRGIIDNAANTAFGDKIIAKLLSVYKEHKAYEITQLICSVFKKVDVNQLSVCCEALSNATPAVNICLLQRGDIDEKHIVKALGSLGKLSRQKSINVTIDFNKLGNLGPRQRLNAMKQLLGMNSRAYKNYLYYCSRQKDSYNYEYWIERYKSQSTVTLPFAVMPTRDEFASFLFPCSMKYNEEVVQIMNRFDDLTNNGGKDGKCV